MEEFDDELMELEPNNEGVQLPEESSSDDDFTTELLKALGIEDSSRIKFENEDGNIEEVNWADLSTEDKLNIIRSSESNPDTDLDDSETQLLNAIRSSGLSPAEYLQYMQKQAVDYYVQNSNQDTYNYNVDLYSDEDLYMFDLMSRTGISEEEAKESLEKAQSNDALFKKLVQAIRLEYKQAELDQITAAQELQQYQQQMQYQQFAQSIANEIHAFKEYAGYNIEMDPEDAQEVYDFLTGHDAAGNNYFAKALADPKLVVQMAYFALNGQRLLDDITNYFQKEITSVGKKSYEKGLADAKNNRSNVIYKNKSKSLINYSDLDDFA